MWQIEVKFGHAFNPTPEMALHSNQIIVPERLNAAQGVCMETLRITTLDPADLDELLEFEIKNRAFFETTINARPTSFYLREGLRAVIEAAADDAKEDKAYQFLMKDRGDRIVGRINLTRVRRAHFHSADLGYRVAESECGKGYAREAVRQVLNKAYGELRLLRIEATSRPENVRSVRILTNAGFTQYGRSTLSFQLGEVWYDTLHFERRAYAQL